jgi:hypothetical protein
MKADTACRPPLGADTPAALSVGSAPANKAMARAAEALSACTNREKHRISYFPRRQKFPSVHCLGLCNTNHGHVHQSSIIYVAKRRDTHGHITKRYRVAQGKQLHFNWFLRRLKQLCSARNQNHYATYQRPQNQFTSTHPNLSLDQCAFVCLSTISHMRALGKTLLIGILAVITVSCGADTTTTDFNATLVGGGEINLQSELQKSPVALWFWAPG